MNRNASVLEAVNSTIESAIESGKLDKDAHAGQIEALRSVARVMDTPGWPFLDPADTGNPRFDNVSPTTLLKYCESLGLNPDLGAKKPGRASELQGMRQQVRNMARKNPVKADG